MNGQNVDDSLPTENGESESIEEQKIFQQIGRIKKNKIKKIHPNIPKWISDSNTFVGDIINNSCELDQFQSMIDLNLINILKQNKIEKFFPVQKTLIPHLTNSFKNLKYCQQRDVCVISPTGSGKTISFAIPIINYLINRIVTQIKVLIILPVSDLAFQVYKVFQSLCKNTTLRVGLASSSKKDSMFYRKNTYDDNYSCLVDILIATPGKLVDLIQRKEGFHLKHLEVLIIDEADRMMNETQFQWLKEIEHSVFETNSRGHCCCSATIQPKSNPSLNIDSLSPCSVDLSNISKKALFKILFSATLTSDPEKLANLSLYYPILYSCITSEDCEQKSLSSTSSKQTIPENLRELMVIIDNDKKPLVLWHLIKDLKYDRILCFTDSVKSTHRLCQLMKQIPDIVVMEFSSKQSIHKRTKLLKKFESGKIHMLVCTDIVARGMDITGINCVVCYDLPRNETAYIHRIGRTARGGQNGTAISLVAPKQLKHFTIISRRAHQGEKSQIEKLLIKNSDLKHLLSDYKKALLVLQNDVQIEQKGIIHKKQNQIKKSKFLKKSNSIHNGK